MIKNKILVVENDDVNSSNIKDYFKQTNYEIDISNSVEDAIYKIKYFKYSLILLDINLPDFDGFEILKFLNKSRIFIPVIIISDCSDLITKIYAFKLGAVDYMIKPIDLDELKARVEVKLKS